MNGREIIKDIMKKQELTNAVFAEKLKITQAALWDRIDTQPRKGKPRKDIPVSLLAEMVQAMNYKVMIVPTNTRVPQEGYVITKDNDIDSSVSDSSMSDKYLTSDEPPAKPRTTELTDESTASTPSEPERTGHRIKLR